MTNLTPEIATKSEAELFKNSEICPSCNEDWTRLRPVIYWEYEAEKEKYAKKLFKICVECAETPRGMEWVMKNWPKAGFDNWETKIKKHWRDPAFVWWHFGQSDQQKVWLWRNLLIEIWVMDPRSKDPEYILTSNGTGEHALAVTKNGEEKVKYFATTIEAWMGIKRWASPPKENDTWGKI